MPIVITPTAYPNNAFTSANMVVVYNMEVATVMAAIDEIGRTRIAGVFACHDAMIQHAARISEALRLPHSDVEANARCNDKLRCRDFLAEKGYKSVDYRRVSTPAEVATAAEALGGRVVVKPRSSTGSLEVKICRSPQEAAEWADQLITAVIDSLILESFWDGPQFSVCLFDGVPITVNRDHISVGSKLLFVGLDTPADIGNKAGSAISDFARNICRTVGCTKGSILVEPRHVNDQCHLVVVNPRPGSPDVVEIHS
ncbi:MAG: ATP-grasp domain-containing protein [Hyphomicrobiaceae bacterium]